MTYTFQKRMLCLVIATVCVSIFSSAHSESFPCQKASSLQEKLICGELSISQLDDELSALYGKALMGDVKNDSLKKQQRDWLKNERNKCSDIPCLERAYRDRIKFLTTISDRSVDQLRSEIAFSTYLGGKGDDLATIIRVDNAGGIYIGGYTQHWVNSFPTLNAVQDNHQGSYSGIVAKFAPDGALQWATHIGGTKSYHPERDTYNTVTGLALDNSGGIYVAGDTTASDFPTVNAAQPVAKSGLETFLSKFNGNGNLVWSTYTGGYGIGFIRAISSDNSGEVYVAGLAGSKGGPGVVAKFDNSGALVWRKEFGNNSYSADFYAIALDLVGNVYIGGETNLNELPRQTGNPHYVKGENSYPFVAKFDKNGEVLWSTKLGGAKHDFIRGIETDRSGMVYVAGNTQSKTFPTLNANQPTQPGRDDAFVAKLSPDGQLLWSTYLGGKGNDSTNAIAVDPKGYVHVTGQTASIRFPIMNAFQDKKAGTVNAFIATFSPEGKMIRSSYLGGNGHDSSYSITADHDANIYVTGWTSSSDFPLKTPHQNTSGGGADIFVTKIDPLR